MSARAILFYAGRRGGGAGGEGGGRGGRGRGAAGGGRGGAHPAQASRVNPAQASRVISTFTKRREPNGPAYTPRSGATSL
ncbi:hypothetical protein B7R21_00905 [Subtercola boreus]|uniref:Uncharacterized protein n=1 Tax=Subtercola boreus TaxID=120213 RepID=A0A3E0W7I3_9MICO|nr:hypothetical protein B7R21_00905 [Subtercola boreus]